MKRSFISTLALVALAVLTIACMTPTDALAQPQSSVVYMPLPIWGTTAPVSPYTQDAGTTWQASTRKYSSVIPFWEFDSVHVIFMFPDSVNVAVKIQYGWDNSFSSPLDSTSAVIDSVLGGASGIYQEYSCYTAMGGGPFGGSGRLVYDFKATKNHAPAYDATTKFRAWYKGFIRVK